MMGVDTSNRGTRQVHKEMPAKDTKRHRGNSRKSEGPGMLDPEEGPHMQMRDKLGLARAQETMQTAEEASLSPPPPKASLSCCTPWPPHTMAPWTSSNLAPNHKHTLVVPGYPGCLFIDRAAGQDWAVWQTEWRPNSRTQGPEATIDEAW